MSKKIKFSFERSPELGLVLTTLLLLLCLVFLGLFYTAGRFYLADVNQGQVNKPDNQEIGRQIEILEKTVDLNKYQSNYRISLSRLYLAAAWQEAQKPQEQRDLDLLRNYASAATSQAQEAVNISPNLVSNWENLGVVWRDLRNLVSGADEASVSALKRAIELEPINPLFPRELCRLYLISGEETNWEETLSYCQEAINLKPNYLDAYVQLALAYERKNDIEKGIKNLEAALERLKGVRFQPDSQLAGAVAEIYFHLGRLYFNTDRIDKASEFFQQAIILVPNHSNARYGLGSAYEQKGLISEALEQFRIVADLNPDNQVIKQKIDQLSRPAPVPETEEEAEETEE